MTDLMDAQSVPHALTATVDLRQTDVRNSLDVTNTMGSVPVRPDLEAMTARNHYVGHWLMAMSESQGRKIEGHAIAKMAGRV